LPIPRLSTNPSEQEFATREMRRNGQFALHHFLLQMTEMGQTLPSHDICGTAALPLIVLQKSFCTGDQKFSGL
jgi:hypothetical protein